MFDPFTLALIGGAAGGLLNKKDPLKGALLGASLGFGGAGLGAAGAAGASGAGAAGGAAQTASLLGVQGASAAQGSQAALLADQMAGFGMDGMNLLGQAAGRVSGQAVPMGVQFGAAMENGMKGLKDMNDAFKPFGDAMGAAQSVNSMFGGQEQPMMPPAQLPQAEPMDLGQIIAANQQQVESLTNRRLNRRQRQSLLG
jgi:hypothetical protein